MGFFISFFGVNETKELILSKLNNVFKLRPLIFKFDPETAHNLAIKSLKLNLISNVFDTNKMIQFLKQSFLKRKLKIQLV